MFLPIYNQISKTVCLIHIRPKKYQAELYTRANSDDDNSDISELILKLFDISCIINNMDFDEELISGSMVEVKSQTPVDMLM